MQGEELTLAPDNDPLKQWWNVRNSSGDIGFVPSNYLTVSYRSGRGESDDVIKLERTSAYIGRISSRTNFESGTDGMPLNLIL